MSMIDDDNDKRLHMWSVRFRRMFREPIYINANTRERALAALNAWCNKQGIDADQIDYVDPPLLPQPRHGALYTQWLKRDARYSKRARSMS